MVSPARKKRQATRRKPAKPVRRKHVASKRPNKAVRSRMSAPRPAQDATAFWQGGDRSSFQVDIATATVPGGTLLRLGPPPLGSAAGRVERALRRTYAAAAAAALALARR
jgi:hypothetical protein